MNKKAFALTETLVVVVFLVSIFTFIYVSIIPLIGKYENTINNDKDIDIVYKLYQVRRVLMSGEYRKDLTKDEVGEITCEDFYKESHEDYRTFCNKLMEQMELRSGDSNYYVLIYAKTLNANNLITIGRINSEIGEYANKYHSQITKQALFLLDKNKDTIANLYYDDTL